MHNDEVGTANGTIVLVPGSAINPSVTHFDRMATCGDAISIESHYWPDVPSSARAV